MRRNEDQNLLKTQRFESAPQQLLPCGTGHASEIQLFANQ
jgi:hypothetical protein